MSSAACESVSITDEVRAPEESVGFGYSGLEPISLEQAEAARAAFQGQLKRVIAARKASEKINEPSPPDFKS